MSSRAIDTGFLRNLITYDSIGNISLPAGLSIFVNKEVATKEYVDAQNNGQVLQSRTLTINGVTYDLSANRSWTINSMVYPSAGIALSSGTGWGTSIVNNSANWNTAFGWGNHASAGYVPYTGATGSADLGVFSLTATGITANSFYARGNGIQGGYIYLKQGGTPYGTLAGSNSITADGTKYIFLSDAGSNNSKTALLDLTSLTNNTNRTFTLPDASGTIALTSNLTVHELLSNKSNNASLGLSDVLYPTQAAVKSYVDSAVTGGLNIQGDWNASTNTPNISGTTTTGFTWRVSVAGSTNLGGITVWNVNDLAVKTASGWIKIDNSSSVVSVYGRQGVVVANTGDYTTAQVTESGSLYFTTARARASFSAGTNISIDANGVIASTYSYTLPTATSTVLGGIKIGTGVTITSGVISVSTNYEAPITAGTTAQYWRGDKTWQTLPTTLAWTSITGRPTTLSSFTNDLGNYGSWITSSGKADGAFKLWSLTHPTDYYMTHSWTGSHWYLTVNHPSAVRVGYADYAVSTDSATYGRYVYDSGLNGGSIGYKEPSALHVKYATDSLRTTYAEIGFYLRNYTGTGARNAEMTFYWSGQAGQPTWLWGSNNGTDIYVWNPANFSVNYATTAGSANDPNKLPLAGGTLTGDLGINGSTNVPLSMNGTEPYMHIIANGGSNTAGIRLYPTNGYNALIGNFRASGDLSIVASNAEVGFFQLSGSTMNLRMGTGNGANGAVSFYGSNFESGYEGRIVCLNSDGNTHFYHRNNSASFTDVGYWSSAGIYAIAFYETSDIRYKNVLETNPNIDLLGVDVIKFTRTDSNIEQIRYGYSAQQLRNILSDVVMEGEKLTVNYMDVHTLKIAALERRVKELEDRLKSTL